MDYFYTLLNEIYKILFLIVPILVSVAMIETNIGTNISFCRYDCMVR